MRNFNNGGFNDAKKEKKSAKIIFKVYKQIFLDMKYAWPSFAFVVILLLINAVLVTITPLLLKEIINNMFDYFSNTPTTSGIVLNIVWSKMFRDFGFILLLYLISALSTWLAEWIIIKISAIYSYETRNRLKVKLDKLPLSYFDDNSVGEILSRCTGDVDNISSNMSNIINQSINSICVFLGVVIAMFIVSWQLALVAIATLPINIIVVMIIGLRSQKQFNNYRKELGDISGLVEEVYGGLNVIKLFNREDYYEEQFTLINNKMAVANAKSEWISGFIFPTMRLISNIGFAAVCVVGGLLQNVGNIVAFILFLQLFQQPFQQIGQIIGLIQSTASGGKRIYELLSEKEEEKSPADAINSEDNIIGNISFKNVDFSYDKNKELIKDMNLEVKSGNTVAIVGPTGAGKTTIVNLIMRFYDIDNGEISLDGINIKDYNRETLRGSVGMVLQDTWLFSGSIKDNIRYGRIDATEEEIIDAARQAHAKHFIETLPGGFDFVLNEDGTNISQGQRQLITIARAIVSQPKILILDEATSSVDTRTELAIQDAMNKMMENKTSFVIAHRLSTIKSAKLILVMKKGSIVEMGTHKELLDKNGFYSDLYNAQFLGKNPQIN